MVVVYVFPSTLMVICWYGMSIPFVDSFPYIDMVFPTYTLLELQHKDMGDVVKFKKVSDCKLDTQSRYIPEGNGKAGKPIKGLDII